MTLNARAKRFPILFIAGCMLAQTAVLSRGQTPATQPQSAEPSPADSNGAVSKVPIPSSVSGIIRTSQKLFDSANDGDWAAAEKGMATLK
jgi:hypothetical protein